MVIILQQSSTTQIFKEAQMRNLKIFSNGMSKWYIHSQ